MEVNLPREQEAQLHDLASQTGRGTDDLIQEAVARMLSHNQWFQQQVQVALTRLQGTSSSKKTKWTRA